MNTTTKQFPAWSHAKTSEQKQALANQVIETVVEARYPEFKKAIEKSLDRAKLRARGEK